MTAFGAIWPIAMLSSRPQWSVAITLIQFRLLINRQACSRHQRRQALSYDEIAKSMMVSDPLRKYMFFSPAEGGTALIICNAD